jgi:hypothetical protein
MDNYPIQLSENILLKAKLGQDSSILRRELYYVKVKKLESYLNNDELKSAFWCNIYNAYVLIIAKENVGKSEVFQYKRIKIAHNTFSLDDIEFKVLGMGSRNLFYKFVCKLFCPSYIRKLALDSVDYSLQIKLNKRSLNTTLTHH